MYCEGFWGEGVCTADMHFSSDPTSCGDEVAEYVRRWYELHRETWWERRRHPQPSGLADEFMLGLIQEVARVESEAARQRADQGRDGA